MSGDCRTVTLTGPMDAIKASYSKDDGAVTAVRYTKDGKSQTFGTLLNKSEYWGFNDNSKLIGLHGRITDGKITQFGVITLDIFEDACPPPPEEPIENDVEEKPKEEETPEEP